MTKIYKRQSSENSVDNDVPVIFIISDLAKRSQNAMRYWDQLWTCQLWNISGFLNAWVLKGSFIFARKQKRKWHRFQMGSLWILFIVHIEQRQRSKKKSTFVEMNFKILECFLNTSQTFFKTFITVLTIFSSLTVTTKLRIWLSSSKVISLNT